MDTVFGVHLSWVVTSKVTDRMMTISDAWRTGTDKFLRQTLQRRRHELVAIKMNPMMRSHAREKDMEIRRVFMSSVRVIIHGQHELTSVWAERLLWIVISHHSPAELLT